MSTPDVSQQRCFSFCTQCKNDRTLVEMLSQTCDQCNRTALPFPFDYGLLHPYKDIVMPNEIDAAQKQQDDDLAKELDLCNVALQQLTYHGYCGLQAVSLHEEHTPWL